MLETIGLTLIAGLAVLGVLVLGYVAWRTKRREEDARQEALRAGAVVGGCMASPEGAGGTRPVIR